MSMKGVVQNVQKPKEIKASKFLQVPPSLPRSMVRASTATRPFWASRCPIACCPLCSNPDLPWIYVIPPSLLLSYCYSILFPVLFPILFEQILFLFYSMLCHVILFSSPSILFWCIDLSACVDYLNIYVYIYIYIYNINLYVYPYPSYLLVHLCTYLLVWHWPRDHWMRGLQDNRACTMQDYVDCGLPKKPEFDDHLQMLRGFCQSEFCVVLYHHGCRTCSSSLSCRPSLCLSFAICRGWVDYDL